jgi:hypothetical protein
MRRSPQAVRLTFLAILCWARTAEVTDGLVDLLIALVHRIGSRAEYAAVLGTFANLVYASVHGGAVWRKVAPGRR